MANKRISELTTITGANLADADLLVVVDVSDTTMASSGTNKKITMAELAKDSALTDNLVAKSTLTTDGDVLTRAAGAPARITRADLAQDSAFSSRYVAKTDDDYIWVSAPAMGATQGSPSLAVNNIYFAFGPAWLLDQSTRESVSGSVIFPEFWTEFKCEVYWANSAASTGDVQVVVSGGFSGAGELVDGVSRPTRVIASSRTLTASSTKDALVVSQFPASSNVAVTAGKPFFVVVDRVADDVADTLANDIAVYGVLLTRTA